MFGFSKIIKIAGKSSFDELTAEEFAQLIESFFSGGSSSFDKIAFNEFLHATVKQPLAMALQRELNASAFLPAKGREWPAVNETFLLGVAARLRTGEKAVPH